MSSTQRAFLTLDQIHVPYLIRQNRRVRHYRIIMTPEDGLVYECKKTPDIQQAAQRVAFHKSWVLQRFKRWQKKQLLANHGQIKAQSILILGVEKPVRILTGQPRRYFLEDKQQITLGIVSKEMDTHEIQKFLTEILQKRAERALPLWLKNICPKNFTYGNVRVKEMKSQWGSCSQQKNISLNWRLLLAPSFVRNYVLAHELAHTQRMDHSEAFWQIVSDILPDYQNARCWLKLRHSALTVKLG